MNILCRFLGHKWGYYYTEINRDKGIKTNWETCKRCRLGREWTNKISKNPTPGERYYSELTSDEQKTVLLRVPII